MDDLDRRIAEANDEFISDESGPTPAPTDLYQVRREIQRDYSKKRFPRGARAEVLATVRDVIGGAGARSLAQAYKRAKGDSEVLKENGDKRRAQLVANQYMEESFLPAVEVVVNFTSPDELLNSKQALDELDKYALGTGAMVGYTEAYLRNAYGDALGQVEMASSPEVEDAVQMVSGALDSYQDALAKGLASKIMKKIKRGEVIASEEDYVFLRNIAS